MEYFYHYAIGDDLVKKIKKEVDDAVNASRLLVNRETWDISTCIGDQYHLNTKETVAMLPQAIKTIKEVIAHCLKEETLYVSNCWTVYGKKGGYHTVHRHNVLEDMCSVLYLEVEKEENPSSQGAFYFFIDGECRRHEPMTGDLLIFPATMWHGTYPQGRDHRHTLNIDFSKDETLLQ
ncbi:putative 2OG-Fe(II) oxygenase [Synechococcus phage S-MS29]|nr:putative 2OG-Fe(II) oxygenase [Synechococcus phage S-MS29]